MFGNPLVPKKPASVESPHEPTTSITSLSKRNEAENRLPPDYNSFGTACEFQVEKVKTLTFVSANSVCQEATCKTNHSMDPLLWAIDHEDAVGGFLKDGVLLRHPAWRFAEWSWAAEYLLEFRLFEDD